MRAIPTQQSVPDLHGGEPLAATFPWFDDGEELRRRRWLRGGLLVAAALHAVVLTLPRVVAPNEPPPRVVRLEPFRVAATPELVAPEPPPPVAPPEPRRAVPRIPVPDLPAPQPIVQPLAPLPIAIDLPAVTAPLEALPLPEAPPAPPDEIVEFGAGIEAPVRLSGDLPAYTPAARQVRASGTVLLEAVIDREGRVVDTKLLRGLPWGLSESALRAVESWRFSPATRNGEPIAVRYRLTVEFQVR